ncbi:MAG: DUF4924 family protein [Bacteroidales bacterium]|nr:DUF4924 family protein [Bacteroidales bacterium]
MLIAAEKLKTNIIEYVLYMWQIEDLIRANAFDMVLIRESIIDKFSLEASQQKAMEGWYEKWVGTMQREELMQGGHMEFLQDLVLQLNDLHLTLINDLQEELYLEQYHWAKPHIQMLKQRIGDPSMCEIEVCLNGLYGLLMMRLQHREVSQETMESLSTFSNLLALLNVKYMENRKQRL